MKIGIFGDSFADSGDHKCKHKLNQTLAWPEILGQQYDVENYAVSGSSFFYSVGQFNKHHSKYDKIVFVVTGFDRFEFNSYVESVCDSFSLRKFMHFRNLTSIEFELENLKKTDVNPIIKSALEAAKNYYIYINDDNRNMYLHNLMLDDVLRTRPDTIVIPAFGHSFPGKRIPIAMADIQSMENIHWNYDTFDQIDKMDIRYCHMTSENNEIFANDAISWINGSPVHLDISKYKKPVDAMSKYFI
jgi:hypothetical protein